MADITMCLNEECPLKEMCYRHIAPVNEHWQSVDMYNWYIGEDDSVECDNFYPVATNRKKQ